MSRTWMWLIMVVCLGILVGGTQAQPLAQYTFNDGTAVDATGNGNDGVLLGTAAIVDDAERGSVLQINQYGMQLDGPFAITTSFTLSAWIKVDQPRTGRYFFGGPWNFRLDQEGDSWAWIEVRYPLMVFLNKVDTRSGASPEGVLDGQWHHLALILPEDGTFQAYFDGVVAPFRGDAHPVKAYDFGGALTPLFIGASNATGGDGLKGYMDDIRVYNYAVPEEELESLMDESGAGLEAAKKPEPGNGTEDVVLGTTLTWEPSDLAATQDVYLSTVFADVNDASRSDERGILVSKGQVDSSYTPENLAFGDTVYWRVDTVEATGTIYKGAVWSYQVEPYAYPVTPVEATASGSLADVFGPSNTINGSGLDPNGGHSALSIDMWQSPFGGVVPAWIQYRFDDVYSLNTMMVWNANQYGEAGQGIGVKDITLDISTDGDTWTPLGDFVVPQAPGVPGYKPESSIDLAGVMAQYVRITIRDNWGGTTPQFSLSEVQFSYVPVQAFGEQPTSGTEDVTPGLILTWRSGREAIDQKVYLGTDPSALPLMTTSTDTAFDTAGIDMLLGQVTYWRIDGSNDGVMWPGDLWQFTTRTYSSVDDFESYTTDSLAEAGQVFEVWFDGYGGFNNSGSTVDFVRTDQKYDGKQSMGFLFNNTGQNYIFQPEKTYSEVYCEVPNPDWIGGGAQALFLAWRGDTYTQPGIDEGRQIPLTESDTLYVVVKDTAGKQAVVPWTGTVADLEAPLWHKWYIGFSDLAGINLSSIDKLYIGIGNRTTPALGGRGMIWVDTIRLTTLE